MDTPDEESKGGRESKPKDSVKSEADHLIFYETRREKSYPGASVTSPTRTNKARHAIPRPIQASEHAEGLYKIKVTQDVRRTWEKDDLQSYTTELDTTLQGPTKVDVNVAVENVVLFATDKVSSY